MQNILTNLTIQPKINSDKYKYEGKFVPRVTEIINSMMHEDYIVQWANNLGFNNKRYSTVLEQSAKIGSYTHDIIEKFIKFDQQPDFTTIPKSDRDAVYNTFYSFINWWQMLKSNHKVNIIFSERSLICPWFGGTLDLLLEIDGKIFLLDFKSSNYPSYKFFIQLGAYLFILNEYEQIYTSGCAILLLNKYTPMFTEILLDFDNRLHLEYIKHCVNTFLSLVHSYYHTIQAKTYYQNIFGKGY
jgi:hypothetical protein